MLGPGVAVPLGLALALESEVTMRAGRARWPARALDVVAPATAAAGVLGWLLPPGHAGAIAAAAAHALACALAGLVGLARLAARRGERFGPLPEIAIDAGLLLLPVAGVWFLASRAAIPLMGFHEPVVTFTAAHFHFAGFAAPSIVGGVGRLLGEGARGLRYRVGAVAVCAGVPLTAIGIATNHVVEASAAVLLACGMLVTSSVLVLNAASVAAKQSRLAAVLFVLSGTTLLLTMTLAATFALTSSAGRGSSLAGAIPLQTMIDWHGGANAMGFALPGLLALTLLARREE